MKTAKKVLAMLLTLALLAGCMLAMPVSNVMAAKQTVYTGDNFDDSTAENLVIPESTTVDLSSGAMVVKGTSSGNAAEVITVDNSMWPTGNLTTKISFDYQANEYVSEPPYYIWLGYDKDTKNGFGLRWNYQDGGLLIRAAFFDKGVYKEFGSNGAKFICAYKPWCDSDAYAVVDAKANVHVEATIDYISDTQLKVTCKLTALDDITVTHSVTYNASTVVGWNSFPKTMVPAFAVNHGFTLDNLVVESYASQALDFIVDNPIVNKSVEEVTIDDAAAYDAALADYAELSAGVTAYLAEEKANLDAIDVKIADLVTVKQVYIGDNFDDGVAENLVISGGIMSFSNGAMVVKGTGTDCTDGIAVRSNRAWPTGNRTTKLSFDYQATDGSNHYIWLGYDASTKNGFGLLWNYDSGGLMIRAGLCVDGAYSFYGDNSAKFLAVQNGNGGANTIMGTVSSTAKVSVEATIEYVSETKVKVTLYIIAPLADGSGNKSGTSSVTYDLNEKYTTSFNPVYPPIFASMNGFTLDNLVVESYASQALDFIVDNPIVNKSVEEVTIDDAAACDAALADYAELSAGVTAYLAEEKANLNAIYVKIAELKLKAYNPVIKGASIRREGTQDLRFAAQFGDIREDKEIVEYGMIITYNKYIGNEVAVGEMTADTTNELVRVVGSTDVKNVAKGNIFYANVGNISSEAYGYRYAVRVYVKYKDETTDYSDIIDRSVIGVAKEITKFAYEAEINGVDSIVESVNDGVITWKYDPNTDNGVEILEWLQTNQKAIVDAYYASKE